MDKNFKSCKHDKLISVKREPPSLVAKKAGPRCMVRNSLINSIDWLISMICFKIFVVNKLIVGN